MITIKKYFIYFFLFGHSSLFCMKLPENILFIKTNNNEIIQLNIKKDLPGGGTLQYLLKKYAQLYKKYNSKNNPLKINISSNELNLFTTALSVINVNVNRFICKNGKIYSLLLKMAIQFKSLKLYLTLISSKKFKKYHLGLLELPELNNKIATTWMNVDHNYIWSKPQKHFFNTILNQTIRFNTTKKKWFFGFQNQTYDKKYFITYHNINLSLLGNPHSPLDNPRSPYLKIYNADSESLIKSFDYIYHFILFKKRNLILLHQSKPLRLILYDINNDYLYTLFNNFPTNSEKPKISLNENYIAEPYNHHILLWNISDTKNITKNEYFHSEVSAVEFNSNTMLLVSIPNLRSRELRLWSIKDNALKLIASYNKCIPGHLFFIDNDTHLIISNFPTIRPKCLNLQINKKENKISLMQTLNNCLALAFLQNNTIDNKNNFFIYKHRLHTPIISTSAGEILFKDQKIKSNLILVSYNKKHIAITDSHNSKLHILHLSYDEKNQPNIVDHTINKKIASIKKISFNKQNSLLLEQTMLHFFIRDLHGNIIKTYQNYPHTYFHPKGNCICINDELHELYNKQTKYMIKNIIENLTIQHYCLLKKICSKENPISIEHNSFYKKAFNTFDDSTKQLYIDQLKLTFKK